MTQKQKHEFEKRKNERIRRDDEAARVIFAGNYPDGKDTNKVKCLMEDVERSFSEHPNCIVRLTINNSVYFQIRKPDHYEIKDNKICVYGDNPHYSECMIASMCINDIDAYILRSGMQETKRVFV